MIDLNQPAPSKLNSIKQWILKKFEFLKNRDSLFYYVLLLIGVSIGFYFVMLFYNLFTTPYSGDYVMQYIPFAYNYYDDWWNFLKTGTFPHWDPNIFLGADGVTSNGYYILFSPFFIPMLFFPRSWILQMMAVISIYRIVLAGLFFRIYLKKLGISEKFARIGGVVYAFCGYMAYHQWFNNFLDIVVLLPLVLYGIEKILKDKKPWVLAISLGVLGIDNFFFFPCIVILTFIYSLFRYFQLIRRNNWKSNLFILGMGAFGYILAIMIGSTTLIPGLLTGMSDPKIEGTSYLTSLSESFKSQDYKTLFGLLFDWSKVPGGGWKYQTYPIIEFFIPPTTCRHISLAFAESGNAFDNNAGSLWVGMPMVFFFFPAIVNSLRHKKWSIIIAIGIWCLLLFTPFSYFLLFGGSKAYARWQIVFAPCIIAYVILFLDKNQNLKMYQLNLGLGFSLSGIFISGILAHAYVNFAGGLHYYLPFPLILFLLAAYIFVLYIAFIFAYQRHLITKFLISISCIEAIAVGTFVAYGHGSTSPLNGNGGIEANNALYQVSEKIQNQDHDFYRMFTSLNIKSFSDNNQNINNYNGVSMFNTLYNYNTRLFKWWSRLSDSYSGWSAGYFEKRQSLDQFLGIKYYVLDKEYAKVNQLNNINYNVPFGFEFVEELSSEQYAVFRQSQYNTIGYSYDEIFTYNQENSPSSALYFTGSYDETRFQVLASEETYLQKAIISKQDLETIDSSLLSDMVISDTLPNIDEMSFKYIKVNDDYYSYSDSNTQYRKSYYHIDNSSQFDVNEIGSIPNKYQKLTSQEIRDIKNNKSGNVFIFISKDDGTAFDYFDEGISIYIDASYELNTKSDIYLLDKDGNIITYDCHSDNMGFSTSSRYVRGFYSNEEVYAIAVYPRYYNWPSLRIAVESKASWENRLNQAKQYPLENIQYVDYNTFKFTTNYDKNRFVVTNIAYEKGWSVQAVYPDGQKQQLNTYLSQGGFVGFIAPIGKVNYILSYINPDFVLGEKLCFIASVISALSYCGYAYINDYFNQKKTLKKLLNCQN